jgi:LPS export ABC transporter permease LptG/LPS export ABC transporter permease LptF
VRALALTRPTILDRYVAREIVPPTGVGLLLFTFVLLLDEIPRLTRVLISRGADLVTVVRAFLYILPSFLSVTIPMAFLLGVLLAFARLAGESEIVAMRASGISPARLLRPVAALSLVAASLTFWVMARALPAANQAYREIIFALAVSKAQTDVRPRVFVDDLVHGMVLYVSDIPAESGEWKDVFIHDVRTPQKPKAILARAARLVINKERKEVGLELRQAVVHIFDVAHPVTHEEESFAFQYLPLPYDEFFPKVMLAKGDREMTLTELKAKVRELQALGKGAADTGRYDVEWHKKFAIPAACVVFGALGLGLSLGSRKEARSAAFALSIAVIFIYYVIIHFGEMAGDMAWLHPFVAMWTANFVFGALATVLVVLNQREAAFDPLSAADYKALLPIVARRERRDREPRPVRPPPRPRVIIRIPRWHLPLPGLLDRYVVRMCISYFTLVLAAFWSLYVLVNFIDLLDDIQRNKVKGKVVLHYYLYESANIVHLMAPLAGLVAILVTFGLLSRRHEITAMKAAGISVYRAALPVFAFGAALSVAMFMTVEFVLPPTKRISNQDYNAIRGRPPQSSSLLERRWVLGSDDSFYNFEYLEQNPPDRITMYGLSVYEIQPATWKLAERLYAGRAAWNGYAYELERGWRRRFIGEGSGFRTFEQARTREIEPPAYFSQENRESETLGFGELRTHIHSLEAKGLDVVKLRVQLHRKIAFPLVSLVMTLLAVPFSFVVARRGALYGIAGSILLAIFYSVCLAVFEALGNNALLPPALAAWSPNIIFAATGLYLLLTVET